MTMAKIAVQRLSDTIAHELERRILEGALKPGDRLQPERELAAELGVSRPSLREAIQKLVSKGLLHSRQGGGTYVTDRLDAGFIDPWQDMLRQHPNIQADLLEFRGMLECEAASLAARRATEADLQRDWESVKGKSRLTWEQARAATRNAWHRVEQALPGDADGDGR